MNLEYSPVVTCVVLMAVMLDDLRLVTRSTISDTKGDTTTTTLLVTILLPRTETVLHVQTIHMYLVFYPHNWEIVIFMHAQTVCTRPLFHDLFVRLSENVLTQSIRLQLVLVRGWGRSNLHHWRECGKHE